MMLFAFIMVLYVSLCYGYLNKVQLKYTKYIMGSNDVSDDIKQATREILMENYQPWLKKQYKSFIRQNAKTMDKVYVRELYQYAICGLLDSLQAYNGSVGLHKYATKFVHGQMCKGMNELAIMKPLKRHEFKNNIRVPAPRLVSYDEYWMFDKLNIKNDKNNRPQIIEHIRQILESSTGEYYRLFYLRYDYNTLNVIRSISEICEIEGYSEETYRKKMRTIIQYITNKLMTEYMG